MPKYKYVIAACARWENEFIVEWLTYYQMLGFDHVYLYCNDDKPIGLYEKILPFVIGNNPFVTFYYYAEQGQHRKMMLHFLDHHINDSEWISFLDIDEFLRLRPNETIGQFMRMFENEADSILFNWVFFGPNGYKIHPGTSVLSTYTRREHAVHPLTKQVTKSQLFRDFGFRQMCQDNTFVHRMTDFTEGRFRTLNVLGDDMNKYFEKFPDGAHEFIYKENRQERLLDIAIVHHYAFRSERAFWDRTTRGLKGDYRNENMWTTLAEGDSFQMFLENINRVEDSRLADQWSRWLSAGPLFSVEEMSALEKASRSLGLSWPLPPIEPGKAA